jgi:Flp pilus assembly protein protease CpaA
MVVRNNGYIGIKQFQVNHIINWRLIMNSMEAMARLLIWGGLIILAVGLLTYVFSRRGGGTFKVPGDIYVKKENFTFYFPIVSCIVLSLIITVILNLFRR